jgi:hypothetical protein
MKINYLIPKLPFLPRLMLFAGLMGAGLFLQLYLRSFFGLGTLCMLAGSLFALARNFNNKPVDLGYEDWKPVTTREYNRIKDNFEQTKKAHIPFYFKPALGLTVLIGLAGMALLLFFFDVVIEGLWLILIDAALILYAPTFTGTVKLWTPAELRMKMASFNAVLIEAEAAGKSLITTPYLRFDKDKENRQIPEDIRLMIEPRRKPADFVGVQFQVAINNGPNGPFLTCMQSSCARAKGRPMTS